MKKNKTKLIIIFTLIILIVPFLAIIKSTGDADKFSYIKSKVPDNFKRYLKENLSYFKAKELEKQSVKLKNENIKINKKRVLKWRNLSENHMKNMDLYLKLIQDENIVSTDSKKYKLKKFTIPFFDLDYYEWEQKPIGYLEQTNEKVYFVTGNGVIMSYDKSNINSEEIPIKLIETNLKQIILDQNFFNIDRISVKDLLIKDEYIYLSYTREQKLDCYNTSIIRSKISDTYLKFKDFFVYEDCVPTSYQEWNAHQTGGTMFSSDNMKHIIFSIGEFRDRKRAQDKDSIFGKVVKINIKNKNYNVISMGHRNVQGLYYEENNKVLIMSEHGPRGGDELNINFDIENKVENYGWPISSYGDHYNNKYPRPEAPLKKSHSKYGFIEPLKYWPISIGIGRVKLIPEDFNNKVPKNSVFLGSMGWLPKQGHRTLYHLVFDDNFKSILQENKIVINERIRDIDFDVKNKVVYLVLENSPAIAMLKFNYN